MLKIAWKSTKRKKEKKRKKKKKKEEINTMTGKVITEKEMKQLEISVEGIKERVENLAKEKKDDSTDEILKHRLELKSIRNELRELKWTKDSDKLTKQLAPRLKDVTEKILKYKDEHQALESLSGKRDQRLYDLFEKQAPVPEEKNKKEKEREKKEFFVHKGWPEKVEKLPYFYSQMALYPELAAKVHSAILGFKIEELEVKVLRGSNLIKSDFFSQSADPYVVIKYHALEKKTPVLKNTLHPEWMATFKFHYNENEPYIHFEVWDHDRIGQHDFMGEVSFALWEVLDSGDWLSRTLPLHANNEDSKKIRKEMEKKKEKKKQEKRHDNKKKKEDDHDKEEKPKEEKVIPNEKENEKKRGDFWGNLRTIA